MKTNKEIKAEINRASKSGIPGDTRYNNEWVDDIVSEFTTRKIAKIAQLNGRRAILWEKEYISLLGELNVYKLRIELLKAKKATKLNRVGKLINRVKMYWGMMFSE